MKFDRLEEFIQSNREAFDQLEPGRKVWKNISKAAGGREVMYPKFWRAAAILLLLTLTVFAGQFIFRNSLKNEGDMGLVDRQIPALLEAEVYYGNLINQKMIEVEAHLVNDPELLEEVKEDISALDHVYEELKEDLRDQVRTEEVIQAMIQNYRLKAEILEDLLNNIESEMNNGKKLNHEEI